MRFIMVETGKHSSVSYIDEMEIELRDELVGRLEELVEGAGLYDRDPVTLSCIDETEEPELIQKMTDEIMAMKVGDTAEWEHSGGGNFYVKRSD